jgi:hypothetical protein
MYAYTVSYPCMTIIYVNNVYNIFTLFIKVTVSSNIKGSEWYYLFDLTICFYINLSFYWAKRIRTPEQGKNTITAYWLIFGCMRLVIVLIYVILS